jgi:hypothetical protein
MIGHRLPRSRRCEFRSAYRLLALFPSLRCDLRTQCRYTNHSLTLGGHGWTLVAVGVPTESPAPLEEEVEAEQNKNTSSKDVVESRSKSPNEANVNYLGRFLSLSRLLVLLERLRDSSSRFHFALHSLKRSYGCELFRVPMRST